MSKGNQYDPLLERITIRGWQGYAQQGLTLGWKLEQLPSPTHTHTNKICNL